MDWFVQKYLQACLVWFGVGVTLGLAMAVVGKPTGGRGAGRRTPLRNSAGSAGLAATAPITRQPKLPLMPQPD